MMEMDAGQEFYLSGTSRALASHESCCEQCKDLVDIEQYFHSHLGIIDCRCMWRIKVWSGRA